MCFLCEYINVSFLWWLVFQVAKIKNDEREDLKVLATGVAAALSARKVSANHSNFMFRVLCNFTECRLFAATLGHRRRI